MILLLILLAGGFAAYELVKSTSGPSAAIKAFAVAIATAEGFYVSGSVSQQAHNPGDLELGDIGNGTTPAANGNEITNFASDDDGWNALYNLLQGIVNGTSQYYSSDMSFSEMATTYAGSSTWATNVANALGASTSDEIGDYLS